MKYLSLVWKNVWRKKIRTTLTILSVVVAFLLFALLTAVGYAFRAGEDAADAERLVTIHKISLINPLPVSYLNRIAATEGVASVTHASWFGGYYQDPSQQFPQFPVEPLEYFEMYPELEIPPEQLDAWSKNRIGAAVGAQLAEQFGWKPGDRIPIKTTIWTQKDGSDTWEFEVEAIFTTNDPRGSTAYMLFHYDYFEEARAFGQGTIGWYVLRVADGANPAAVAEAVDLQFENSSNQTETSTEQAFAASFARMFGNIALIVTLILGAVFFTLLLVAGNTMSQSVRERIAELAVLKTVGFGDGLLLTVVLLESVLVMLIGGLLGVGLGWLFVQGIARQAGAMLPGIYLTPQAILLAVGLMVAGGILAGLFPALKARRLTIVDALARG